MLKLYPLLIFSFLPFALLAQEKIEHVKTPVSQDAETVPFEPARPIKKNGKFGWVDNSTGQTLIPFEYDTIIYPTDLPTPYFIVKQNSLYGVLNGKGKVIIEPAYQQLENWTVSLSTAETEKWPAGDLLFRAKKDEKWGIINNHNKVILPFDYSFIRCKWNLVFVARKEDKWGMVNWKGEIKAPFQYDEMEGISMEGYRVRMGKLNGIITNNGKFILPVRYSTIKPFMNSKLEFEYWYLVTGTNSKKGFLNAEKLWPAIPVQYDNIADVNADNIIIAVSANKYGVINAQNKILVPFQYDQLKFLSIDYNKPLLARVKGKYGLIDLANKKRIPVAYDDLQPISGGFYKACNNGQCKVINAAGQTITKEEYDNIGVYINGKAPVFKNGQLSYIDTFGVAGNFVPSDACGYTDLHKLLADLTKAMNAKNDSLLHAFCKNITPDKHTVSFLKRSRYKNRTLVNDIERMRAYTLESRQQEIFDEMKRISSTVQDAQHTPWIAAYVPTQYDRLTMLESEPFCIESMTCLVSLRSGTKEVTIDIGRLTRMDGFWKTSYVPFVAGIPPVN
ncbi:WG repeat-containing protein [Niastella caeni]|uniref:WG repeat-containing protein n=1 Tax=Niastella caeni TaxID=2569763 RepID=A0A4S8HU60_9BACT|nr:WG repeat-containing protein [Niastella caeni]THU38169.1 WG repeat-containing protein [Niastella caeni]